MAGTPAREPLDRGTLMALVALGLAIFLVANDFTALSVALPNMEADLDAGVGTVQWVINAYALVFGVLIVTGGRLAARVAPGAGRPAVTALSVALVALLLALDQATDWGWGDPRIVALLAVCAVGAAAFVPIERRTGARALIPADVVRNRTFSSACAAVVLMSAVFFAILLYAPQIMQKLMGFSALQAGLGFLPFMATFSVASFVSGSLYERLGGKLVLVAGAACLPAGILLLSLVGEDSGFSAMVPGLVVAGIGVGLFYSTIGLGLTTTIFTAQALSQVRADGLADQLDAGQEHAVAQLLAGGDGAEQLTRAFPQLAAELEQLAREAFTQGVQIALRVDAAIALAGFLVVLLFVGGRLRLRPQPSPSGRGPASEAAGS